MSQEKFIELITKELLGELSADEYQELHHVVKNDPSYAKQRNNFKMYWESDRVSESDEQALFQKISTVIREQEPDFNSENDVPLKKSVFSILWKAAAVLFIIASIYLVHSSSPRKLDPAALNVVQTLTGEKRKITLPDGTIVTINAASRLSFPTSFKDSIREVYLLGEAFFDVKKDRLHPFIIHTGKMDIRVLGTAFNVKAYGNDKFAETTLIRGSVQVTLTDRPKDRIILKPTEKLVVKYDAPANIDTSAIAEKSNALSAITYLQKRDNTVIETSWLENKLIFKDEDFESLAHSLERRYGVRIQFHDASIRALKFTGIFEKETITEALNALQLTESFKYQILTDQIMIY